MDSTSKDGSDGYLNWAMGREWRPADRLTRQFESRRQYLSDVKWLISSMLCPMKSRQNPLERARNLQNFNVTDATGSTVRPWVPSSFHNRRR